MKDSDRIEQLLTQLIDVQRAHLDEYKRVTSQSLDLQRSAVEAQSRHVLLYRRVIVAAAIIIAGLGGCALWLSRLIP